MEEGRVATSRTHVTRLCYEESFPQPLYAEKDVGGIVSSQVFKCGILVEKSILSKEFCAFGWHCGVCGVQTVIRLSFTISRCIEEGYDSACMLGLD